MTTRNFYSGFKRNQKKGILKSKPQEEHKKKTRLLMAYSDKREKIWQQI